jgi:hypothetical protein
MVKLRSQHQYPTQEIAHRFAPLSAAPNIIRAAPPHQSHQLTFDELCSSVSMTLFVLTRPVLWTAFLLSFCAIALECGATSTVRQWRFEVTADGIPVGTHEYALEESDGTRTIQSEMRFRIRLLLIDAYRYEHRATERWQNDCLTELDTHTEERGRTTDVKGHLDSKRFEVEGASGHIDLPACVMTFAYWNPGVLKQSHLINPQTGAWTPVTTETLGSDVIDVRGQPRKADHYRIRTDKNQIELWYASDNGEWLRMRTTTNDGHVLAYRLH